MSILIIKKHKKFVQALMQQLNALIALHTCGCNVIKKLRSGEGGFFLLIVSVAQMQAREQTLRELTPA